MKPDDVERAVVWIADIYKIDNMLRSKHLASLTVMVRDEQHTINLSYPHWQEALRTTRRGLMDVLRRVGVDTTELE